jgi:hypothetical protein
MGVDPRTDQVMADAADPVQVRHTLRQIVNVKREGWLKRRLRPSARSVLGSHRLQLQYSSTL